MQVEIYGININKDNKKQIKDFFIEKAKELENNYSKNAIKIKNINIFVEINK